MIVCQLISLLVRIRSSDSSKRWMTGLIPSTELFGPDKRSLHLKSILGETWVDNCMRMQFQVHLRYSFAIPKPSLATTPILSLLISDTFATPASAIVRLSSLSRICSTSSTPL